MRAGFNQIRGGFDLALRQDFLDLAEHNNNSIHDKDNPCFQVPAEKFKAYPD
jgi:hypothetical protein